MTTVTDWQSRIDALLAEKPAHADTYGDELEYYADLSDWDRRRLSLAAQRMREPHKLNCEIGMIEDRHGNVDCCNCGHDADVLRVLEGK